MNRGGSFVLPPSGEGSFCCCWWGGGCLVWPEAMAAHVGRSHSVAAIHSVTQFDFVSQTGSLLGSEALDRYEPYKGTTTIAQTIEKRPVGKTSRLILKSQHHAGYGNGASSNQKAGPRRSATRKPKSQVWCKALLGNRNPGFPKWTCQRPLSQHWGPSFVKKCEEINSSMCALESSWTNKIDKQFLQTIQPNEGGFGKRRPSALETFRRWKGVAHCRLWLFWDFDTVCRAAAHLGHRKWNANPLYAQTKRENVKYNILAGKRKWSRCSTETRDRRFRQCKSSCLSDASGKNFVEEFAIEKMNIQTSHLLGSNARWVLPNDCHQVSQVKSSQTCTPILAGPFRAQAQNVSNCSTNMLHKGESSHSRHCKIKWRIRNVDPKGSDSWQHPSIAPSLCIYNTIRVSTPNGNVGGRFGMCQPGTNAKFVEPNALATTWRHVALASNNSNNKCATMFWCWLYR